MEIRCAARPYEGENKYIFVSYCHKDKAAVYPVVEQLAKEGYRVWYDEGIDPGSEWPEVIAAHLYGCQVCIAFISKNSVESHNCKREVNFALLKQKPFISVVIEDVKMSLGMEMQLSATRAIFKYKLSDSEFYSTLYSAEVLKDCLGEPSEMSFIKDENECNDGNGFRIEELQRERNSFSTAWLSSDNNEQEKSAVQEDLSSAYLNFNKTGKSLVLDSEKYNYIGRSREKCSIVIPGNSMVSRCHARITKIRNKWYLMDCDSRNGTTLNQRKLLPEYDYPLSDNDVIGIANEKLIFEQRKA